MSAPAARFAAKRASPIRNLSISRQLRCPYRQLLFQIPDELPAAIHDAAADQYSKGHQYPKHGALSFEPQCAIEAQNPEAGEFSFRCPWARGLPIQIRQPGRSIHRNTEFHGPWGPTLIEITG
jgi:hypothetical protein